MNRYISNISLALLIISILSGSILVFAYHPSNAYDSLQRVMFIIPYGNFFRKIHYFSSEALIVSVLIHIFLELRKQNIYISKSSYIFSILGTFFIIMLLFSGFILKGDFSANSAMQVAFSLMRDTPFLNKLLPLFQDNYVIYWKFFIWHIIFFTFFLLYSLYKHIKRFNIDKNYLILALGLTIVISLIVPMPRDISIYEKTLHVKGPWFFWGAENLLQMGIEPYFINILLIIPLLLLMLIYKNKYSKIFKIALLIWLVSYVYISF